MKGSSGSRRNERRNAAHRLLLQITNPIPVREMVTTIDISLHGARSWRSASINLIPAVRLSYSELDALLLAEWPGRRPNATSRASERRAWS